jgi:hypothetical protein
MNNITIISISNACEKIKTLTAIPEEPFNNKDGTRVGSKDGSFCELSKFGVKSTCRITNSSMKWMKKEEQPHAEGKTSME